MTDTTCDLPGGYLDDIAAVQKAYARLEEYGMEDGVAKVHVSGGPHDPTFILFNNEAQLGARGCALEALRGSGYRGIIVNAIIIELDPEAP